MEAALNASYWFLRSLGCPAARALRIARMTNRPQDWADHLTSSFQAAGYCAERDRRVREPIVVPVNWDYPAGHTCNPPSPYWIHRNY